MSKKVLLAAIVVCAGCSTGPSLEGTWTVSGVKNMPPGSQVQMTFTKPDVMKVHVEVEQEIPGAGKSKVKLDSLGTYKYDGKTLTTHTDSVKFDLSALPANFQTMLKGQMSAMEKSFIEQQNKETKFNLTFKGADQAISKDSGGTETTLTRVKA